MTRLDDLLGYDEAPRKPRRRRHPATGIVTSVVIALIAARLIDLLLRAAYQVTVPYLYLASALLCVVGLRTALRMLAPAKLPASLRDAPVEPPSLSNAEDGIREAVSKWSARLDWSTDDVKRFDQLVRPGLTDIVDEKLRLVHGVSRDADPDRARAIVPDRLWSFIHEPAGRMMNAQEFATLVAQMEAL